MQGTIEFLTDAAGEHRFHVKAANGEIIATSEGYTRRDDAERGAVALKRALGALGYVSTGELLEEITARLTIAGQLDRTVDPNG